MNYDYNETSEQLYKTAISRIVASILQHNEACLSGDAEEAKATSREILSFANLVGCMFDLEEDVVLVSAFKLFANFAKDKGIEIHESLPI